MTFDSALRLRGKVVREDKAHACRFLESQGFRYGKDFHIKDAILTAGAVIIELEADSEVKRKKQKVVSRCRAE
jgi:hypothetical protein